MNDQGWDEKFYLTHSNPKSFFREVDYYLVLENRFFKKGTKMKN